MTCAWGCTEFAADDPECAELGIGAMALRMAWLGFPVLPLARGGKRPHRMLGGSGGVHHATCDPRAIRDWWRADRSANLGVGCGENAARRGEAWRGVARLALAGYGAAGTGLVVLDCDVKHNQDGLASLLSFLRENRLALPGGTPVVETPSGGRHLYLRTPPGGAVPDRPGILPGLDVKGGGGYVCAPPSAIITVPHDRSGGGTGEVPAPYFWRSGCPHLAPLAPAWLLPWLASAAATGTSGTGHPSQGDMPDPGQPLTVGTRNKETYRLACSLFRKLGTNAVPEVMSELRDVWEKTDHADFPWSEVVTSAVSARRFIERSAAQEAERNKAFLAWLYRRLPAGSSDLAGRPATRVGRIRPGKWARPERELRPHLHPVTPMDQMEGVRAQNSRT